MAAETIRLCRDASAGMLSCYEACCRCQRECRGFKSHHLFLKTQRRKAPGLVISGGLKHHSKGEACTSFVRFVSSHFQDREPRGLPLAASIIANTPRLMGSDNSVHAVVTISNSGSSVGGMEACAPDFAPACFDFFDFPDDFEGCSTPLGK